jgi:NADH:ubiquinone oxidoreductase subunit H
MEFIYLTITNLIKNFLKSIFQGGFLFLMPLSQLVICTIIKLICVLIAVAYFTIAERKAMASIQRRKGPNVVGF